MKFLSLTIFVFYLSFSGYSQSKGDIQWSKNGDSFYDLDHNSINEYQLPSFTKKFIVDSQQLVPKGQKTALEVKSFSFSEDGKKVLIFTNTKKVWRRNTRGDYWLLNLQTKSLLQLGKGRPSSSLMFAKISPDGTKAAYVSEHNIFVEELGPGIIHQLTTGGTRKLINCTFDWAYEEEFF